MDGLGISERIESKLDQLISLVLHLHEVSGDGIGRVFNKDQAAEFLGISKGAIDQRMRAGSIPFVKNAQGHVRFAETYLKRCELGEDPELLTQEMNRKFRQKGR